jgi:hypothetical protein
MLDQVQQAINASIGEYDDEAIMRELVDRYGLVDIDDIEHNEFWNVVMRHGKDDEPTTGRPMSLRTRVLGGGLLALALVALVVGVIAKQQTNESEPVELSLSEVVETCDGGTMIDGGTTLEMDTLVPGEPITVQDADTEVMCIFGQLGTPQAFQDAMYDTRAIEGQLERTEGGYHYWWWFHQDSGLHVYVSATEGS